MDSKNNEQGNSLMNSDIQTNYPPVTDSSLQINQYPLNQYQSPDYPPEYQNQNNQISQNQAIMQNYPVNNKPQQFIQAPPSLYNNNPVNVQDEQNFSLIPHKGIIRPQINKFLIKRHYDSIYSCIMALIFGSLVSLVGLMCYIYGNNLIIFCSLLFFGLFIIIIIGYYNFIQLNKKYEIIFEDNYIKVINKAAYCCRRKVSIYQRNELIEYSFKSRFEVHRRRRRKSLKIEVYDFFLKLKSGKKEKIMTAEASLFTEEETDYLYYYANNYINNKI